MLERKLYKIEKKLKRKKNKAQCKGEVHTTAKVGFALGVLSVITYSIAFSQPAFFVISLLLAIIGLILSIIGLKKTSKGKGWAIAGLVSSILGILGGAFLVFVILAIAGVL